MNSCIITGATGYIGSHLLKYLLKKGWNVHIIADSQFGYDNIVDVMPSINIFMSTPPSSLMAQKNLLHTESRLHAQMKT